MPEALIHCCPALLWLCAAAFLLQASCHVTTSLGAAANTSTGGLDKDSVYLSAERVQKSLSIEKGTDPGMRRQDGLGDACFWQDLSTPLNGTVPAARLLHTMAAWAGMLFVFGGSGQLSLVCSCELGLEGC